MHPSEQLTLPAKLNQGSPTAENWRTINDLLVAMKTLNARMLRMEARITGLQFEPTVKEGGGDGGGDARWS